MWRLWKCKLLLPYGISSLQNLHRGKFVNTMFENFRSQFVTVTFIARCAFVWMCLNTAELAFDPRATLITQCTRTSDAYRKHFSRRQSGQGVMLTSASRAEVMSEWIYTFAPPIRLHGTRSLATALPLLRSLPWIWAEQLLCFIPQTCGLTFSRHRVWKFSYFWNVIPCSLVDIYQSCRVT
jgi:hypothetical protein